MTNFGCGTSCGVRGFGRRGNPQAAKAMKMMRKEGISLKEAWKRVQGRSSRRKRRSSRKARRSRRLSRRNRRRSSRRARRSSRRSRRFGQVMGPGFAAATSYPNAYANFFGNSEPFVSASNWWYPYTNGVAQSPQMLMKSPLAGYKGPGN